MDELLKELQALIDKYAEGTPEGVTEEEAKQDEERMAELTADDRAQDHRAGRTQRKTRAAAVAAARSAIESGSRAEGFHRAAGTQRERRRCRRARHYRLRSRSEARLAQRHLRPARALQLGGGNEMTTQERAAFTALTTNTDAVSPEGDSRPDHQPC